MMLDLKFDAKKMYFITAMASYFTCRTLVGNINMTIMETSLEGKGEKHKCDINQDNLKLFSNQPLK